MTDLNVESGSELFYQIILSIYWSQYIFIYAMNLFEQNVNNFNEHSANSYVFLRYSTPTTPFVSTDKLFSFTIGD